MPSLAEHAVLGLITERPRHGWDLVKELAPGAPLGRVWSLSRPLTYRALDHLAECRLVRATKTEAGEGPRRTIWAPTAAGRRVLDRWLSTPVEHLRDVRAELLLKLLVADRLRVDPRPLLEAQRATLRPIVAGLARAAAAKDADDVDRWRHESAVAVDRFLDGTLRARRRGVRSGEDG
jgi:PadR family transcriptional regulator AphA